MHVHCTATENCVIRKANKVGEKEKKEFWSSVQSSEKHQEEELKQQYS